MTTTTTAASKYVPYEERVRLAQLIRSVQSSSSEDDGSNHPAGVALLVIADSLDRAAEHLHDTTVRLGWIFNAATRCRRYRNGSEPLMSRPSSGGGGVGGKQATISPSQRSRLSTSPTRRMGDPAAHQASSSAVMDLSFVTERILSLSFPAEMEASTYRQALHQAAAMLQTKHGDNYMVFNLSLPRKEIAQWNQRVLDVGWPDQLAPPLERLCSVCRALDSWLQADPQHVAVLHSKCGLQRVGVVVSSYCEYTGLCPPNNQDQSLDRFSMKRFLNERVGGLRTPSDKRYVEYFAGLLSGSIQVNSSPLFLDHLTVVGIPAFQSNGGCRAFFKVYQGSVPVHTSSIYNLHDSARHFTVPMGERGLALRGDILVKCYHRHRGTSSTSSVDGGGVGAARGGGRETVFSLQFHTCAVTQHTLIFQRQDLDDACQDLRFPLDGSVRLHFSTGPDSSRLLGVNETHTRYTVEPSTGDPVVRWDSLDTVADSDHDVTPNRLAHTQGPLDGSLYAKVLKNSGAHQQQKSPTSGVRLGTSTVTALGSNGIQFGDLPGSSVPDYRVVQHQQHLIQHHPHQFLNSPHVASTDSGISSTGLVRRGSASHREPGSHSSQSGSAASASPPHSGHSAAFTDPPSTPSPVQNHHHHHQHQVQHHQQQHLYLSKMPSIVETRAEVHSGGANGAPPSTLVPPLTATAELDQLLSGMLMNVQNIPDIRPERMAHFTKRGDDIDVDSIQVNFDLTPNSRDTTADSTVPSPLPAPVVPTRKTSNGSGKGYVYESDTVRRAAPPPPSATNGTTMVVQQQQRQQQPEAVRAQDIPYHAREDSKPFTYGMVTANGTLSEATPASPSIHRRNWKESSSNTLNGQSKSSLESPSLVRKFSTGSEHPLAVNSSPRSVPRIPPPAVSSPRPVRKLSETSLLNGSSSPQPQAPAPVSNGGGPAILPVATSSPRLDATRQRSVSATEQPVSKPLVAPSPVRHQISLEESIQDVSTSPDSASRMSTEGLSWLQRQQQKLRERKDSMRRAERNPQEVKLMSELRSSHQFKGLQQQQQQQQQHQPQMPPLSNRPGDDGYLSDVTLFSELDMVVTSREGSPDIRPLYATPLHINTSTASSNSNAYGRPSVGNLKPVGSSSNPASPLLTNRSSSLERSAQQQQAQKMVLTRQKSDLSHDRERPFMAVKRAHENHLKALNSGGQSPNDLLVAASPYGLLRGFHHHQLPSASHSPSSGGLLTTTDGATTSSPTVGPVSRMGNLDRLIQTLNTNLPDHLALLRQPNLTPTNLKYLLNHNNNNVVTSTPKSPTQPHEDEQIKQAIALTDLTASSVKSPSTHNTPRKLSDVARANLTPVEDTVATNFKFTDSVMSWNSSISGEDLSNRPTTPGFPVVPRTPYLNVHHHHGGSGRGSVDSPVTPTSSHSGGTGLPPKSPTTQRRNPMAGAVAGGGSPYSPTPPNAKVLRKWPSNSSVSSKERSPSPSASSAYLGQHSRRSSIQSVGAQSEPQEVSPVHVNFVKDTSKFWYKPNIAREDAINMLKEQSPGTFIVRDSNSFPGAFGLALKVATPPPHAAAKVTSGGDLSSELVRHFLIEPTSKGVRIKGCSNEPVFGSLSALIYQHSVTPLALPIKLVLPDSELVAKNGIVLNTQPQLSPTTQLLTQGAACSLLYLFTMDTESLTGPQAIQRTMSHLLDTRPLPSPTIVHFKVSSQGITLTDNERKLFFRRHYPVATVSHCGLDPEDRRWIQRSDETGLPISSNRCFGFIARKPASKTDNQCHIFAELEAEQPATAIVNFVTKVMMTSSSSPSKTNV